MSFYPQDTFCEHCGHQLFEPYDPEKATHSGPKYKQDTTPNPRLEAVARALETKFVLAGFAVSEKILEDMAQAALATVDPELEALREALAFYANADWLEYEQDAYADAEFGRSTKIGGFGELFKDKGDRARAALNKENNP